MLDTITDARQHLSRAATFVAVIDAILLDTHAPDSIEWTTALQQIDAAVARLKWLRGWVEEQTRGCGA